jgi:hypothetical protein
MWFCGSSMVCPMDRVEFENGHLRIPPLPPAWINVEAEFEPGSAFEEGKCVMAVSRNGGDDPVRISSKSRPISSPTVPPPNHRRSIRFHKTPISSDCKPTLRISLMRLEASFKI